MKHGRTGILLTLSTTTMRLHMKTPCAPPPRHKVCRVHDDCPGDQLVCRLNGGVGVCMDVNTCAQHTHCTGGAMCAGDGSCAKPAATVTNALVKAVAVQTHAQTCSLTKPTSHFQNVPNFTRAVGLCKFRNWFQAQEVQRRPSVQEQTPLLLVPATDEFLLSEETWDPPISEFLRLEPHVCDRSYHIQKDFYLCSGSETLAVDATTGDVLAPYKVLGLLDASNKVRMCDLRFLPHYTGFLNPYINRVDKQDSLMMVPRTIQRCAEFKTCPKPVHHVEGRTVQRRLVLVANADGTRTTTTREHCGYDVERCWGAGYVLGDTCTDAISQKQRFCVVDLYVVPMLWVVFGTDPRLTLLLDPPLTTD